MQVNVLLYCALCNVTHVYHYEKLILLMSRLLQDSSSDKSRPSGSGSSNHVTSPPPISLGRKVEVDLREKQKKFEGLDKQAVEVIINSIILSTQSWFPEIIFKIILKHEFLWRNANLTRDFISSSRVPIFCVSRIATRRENQDEILQSRTSWWYFCLFLIRFLGPFYWGCL